MRSAGCIFEDQPLWPLCRDYINDQQRYPSFRTLLLSTLCCSFGGGGGGTGQNGELPRRGPTKSVTYMYRNGYVSTRTVISRSCLIVNSDK